MKLQDTLLLLKSGYTKDEIKAFEADSTGEDAAPISGGLDDFKADLLNAISGAMGKPEEATGEEPPADPVEEDPEKAALLEEIQTLRSQLSAIDLNKEPEKPGYVSHFEKLLKGEI